MLVHRVCRMDARNIAAARLFEQGHGEARLPALASALEIAVCGVLDSEKVREMEVMGRFEIGLIVGTAAANLKVFGRKQHEEIADRFWL